MSLIYWDTMLFIYWMENHPLHGKEVERIQRRMVQRGDQLCTSVFAVGEVLTGFYKGGRINEVQQVRTYFLDSGQVQILAFDAAVAERYARIRAQHKVSPGDAIHLATASVAQVDLYVTNDEALKKLVIDGIHFIAGLDGSIF